MCGLLYVDIISTANLVVLKGGFFNKKCVKKWWQIALKKCIVKFKTLHFENVILCTGI